jgi:hypothetical protein
MQVHDLFTRQSYKIDAAKVEINTIHHRFTGILIFSIPTYERVGCFEQRMFPKRFITVKSTLCTKLYGNKG